MSSQKGRGRLALALWGGCGLGIWENKNWLFGAQKRDIPEKNNRKVFYTFRLYFLFFPFK